MTTQEPFISNKVQYAVYVRMALILTLLNIHGTEKKEFPC